MKRVLIIQTAFLGDVILATPLISELKRLFPEVEIDMLVKKGNESLISGNPFIRNCYVLDKENGKWKAIRSLIRSIRNNQYDLVLNLHRFGSSGLIAVRSGAKRVFGFRKNPFSFLYTKRFDHEIGTGKHEVERNLSLLEEFGAVKIIRPELYPSSSDDSKTKSLKNQRYVCLAPASVWYTKQLPIEKWIELCDQLTNETVYLIGGPNDRDLCETIRTTSSNPNIITLAGELSLMESASLIRDAAHAYVNDSGPLHIASAMNTPTTAFFCSTIPDFGFGPLAAESEVREVAGLSCRPCGLHGHKACPKGDLKCGNEMDVRI